MALNILTITGRIGRDAEYRAFPNGGGVITFSVATNSGYGDKEKTLWFRGNIFGKRAEGNLKDYLVKGQEVAISGELSENEYTDRQTQEARKTLEINVREIELLGGSQRANNPAPSQANQPQQNTRQPQAGSNYLDDDIPF